MYPFSASGSLPDKITVAAARAAFTHVFSGLRWGLRFDTLDPPALDIEAGSDFDQVVNQHDAWDFQDQARGWVALRIQDLTVAVDQRRLSDFGFDFELIKSSADYRDAALVRIRESIKNRIRAEIDDRFDDRLSTWERRMETAIALTDEATRAAVVSHVGLDQRVEGKPLKKAANYVFDRLGLRVAPYGSSLVVVGDSYRIPAIRKAVTAEEQRDRANSLVLRAVDTLVHERRDLDGMTSMDLLAEIRSVIKDVTARHGSLGLIDIIKRKCLVTGCFEDLVVECPVLTALMREQRERLSEMSMRLRDREGHSVII